MSSSGNRPNPVLWLWYVYGGRLPERYREWVLHDVTCRTWALRHIARVFVQVSPGLLVLLLPGPLWITAMCVVGGLLMSLLYSTSSMVESCETRLVKHGYPLGTGREKRAERQAENDAEAWQRYVERYRS
ncbi:hypothetical protein SAMN04487819_10519 [Actinopolyspora alba]|uniref:DUF5313 domain-containing protein n=1 Tax=Actinopolyspora alba TaxID=673379 RepID=A0A1I1W6A9_9ACTN|nr:DUF5313 family protein [Actinopolyspora alba]SFD90662.1 hypothetical protein SAMN04487819_10519 [Actinopolyspora alba]